MLARTVINVQTGERAEIPLTPEEIAALPPPPPPPDWRPAAWVELRSRRDRLLTVLSGMQSDYITTGDMAEALLCLDAKQGLKDITDWPAIVAVVNDADGTREQFNDAVVARWTQIADPAPSAVKAEFYRYATEP
jgi:hypothetical protein